MREAEGGGAWSGAWRTLVEEAGGFASADEKAEILFQAAQGAPRGGDGEQAWEWLIGRA